MKCSNLLEYIGYLISLQLSFAIITIYVCHISEHKAVACLGGPVLQQFNMECNSSIPNNNITILYSTSFVSTYNLSEGCCTNPGDCTQTSPDHAMNVINTRCEGKYSCMVTITLVNLPECNYTHHNYQEVIYSCGTPTTGRILQQYLASPDNFSFHLLTL